MRLKHDFQGACGVPDKRLDKGGYKEMHKAMQAFLKKTGNPTGGWKENAKRNKEKK